LEHNEAEELLVKRLTEEISEPSPEEAKAEAVKRLFPRSEIRIQAERDPVTEETKAYRAIASEVDRRYDGRVTDSNERKEKDEGHSR
jgi:hypothetical protein